MILGPDGRNIDGNINSLLVPEFLIRDQETQLERAAAERRVWALREVCNYDHNRSTSDAFVGVKIGQTIQIRKPRRYA